MTRASTPAAASISMIDKVMAIVAAVVGVAVVVRVFLLIGS
jgi:hypothetical protein